ncbi:MAG: hypothetical protein HC819_13205 [Cyclobacteriaceae bacterium]|nr:hypothetical protein [Cyclobacteriaceae bacterium]
MDAENNVQKRFFAELKSKLPSNLSMARVVADELSISVDSAYRRIRGESHLSLLEFDLLMTKYAISTEAILSRSFDSVHFDYHSLNNRDEGLPGIFNYLSKQLKSFSNFGLKEIVFLASDLPVFYLFMYPHLASFKMYCWRQMFHQLPSGKYPQFDPGSIDTLLDMSYKLLQAYLDHPSIEIWNTETIHSTMNQVLFCHKKGMFESKQDIGHILDELIKVLEHVEKQAEYGHKFDPAAKGSIEKDKPLFSLYQYEGPIPKNQVLVKLEHFELTYIAHYGLNMLTTNNQEFYLENRLYAGQLMAQATDLATPVGRKLYFNGLYHKIDALKNNL